MRQLLYHVTALEVLLQMERERPVNVKRLYGGEEDIGNLNFAPSLARHDDALTADVVVPLIAADRGPATPESRHGGTP